MSKVVIAGGSGFIGSALGRRFDAVGRPVVILSRRERPPRGNIRTVAWDGRTVGAWAGELEGATLLINLAGASISMAWTPENQKLILDSRVESARVLGKVVASLGAPPARWINASAVGIYGDTGDRIADEDTPPGPPDFLTETCRQWEAAAQEACPSQVPLSLLRIGVVQGTEGGSFPVLYKLARAFLGGSPGSGKQWLSWIHLDDLVEAILFIEANQLDGTVNGVAPNPVRMAEFMRALREAAHRPWSPPIPAPFLRLAEKLGSPPADLVLMSQRVAPRRLTAADFPFRFPTLEPALADLAKKSS